MGKLRYKIRAVTILIYTVLYIIANIGDIYCLKNYSDMMNAKSYVALANEFLVKCEYDEEQRNALYSLAQYYVRNNDYIGLYSLVASYEEIVHKEAYVLKLKELGLYSGRITDELYQISIYLAEARTKLMSNDNFISKGAFSELDVEGFNKMVDLRNNSLQVNTFDLKRYMQLLHDVSVRADMLVIATLMAKAIGYPLMKCIVSTWFCIIVVKEIIKRGFKRNKFTDI